jgi:hypothetical protein
MRQSGDESPHSKNGGARRFTAPKRIRGEKRRYNGWGNGAAGYPKTTWGIQPYNAERGEVRPTPRRGVATPEGGGHTSQQLCFVVSIIFEIFPRKPQEPAVG